MMAGCPTFRPETAHNFPLHGKIAASLLFCENEVLEKPSGFAQKSQKFPAGTSDSRPSRSVMLRYRSTAEPVEASPKILNGRLA
jgi:hypothetical protein